MGGRDEGRVGERKKGREEGRGRTEGGEGRKKSSGHEQEQLKK